MKESFLLCIIAFDALPQYCSFVCWAKHKHQAASFWLVGWVSLQFDGSALRQFYTNIEMDQKVTPQYMALKAGMDSVNKEFIAKKVAELTAGTPKDLHEKQLDRKRNLEIASMLQKVMEFSQQQKHHMKEIWKAKIDEINEKRDLSKYWAHFDFDMFYVAAELLDKPQYANVPCGVGGDNSVLCTANYAARLLGIRAAMPTFIAKKLCPQLILFKPNFQKYHKFSQTFKQILRKFDENLESHGLDEAYIQLTPYLVGKTLQEQEIFVQAIRAEVFAQTGLTVSCGVGANKLLAKIASDVKKPNNQFIIPNDSQKIIEFMRSQPNRKIPGIGPVNELYLQGLGIRVAGDILNNTDLLTICFSETSCQFFIESALGVGCSEHEFRERKSVGKSETFRPTCDQKYLSDKLLQLCEQVSMQLQELEILTMNVVFSYHSENYEKKDKSFRLDKYTTDKNELLSPILKFLNDSIIATRRKIRLLGVRCTQIIKAEDWKRKSLQSYFAREKIKTNYVGDQQGNRMAVMLQEIKEVSDFLCPICNQEIQCMNNLAKFNRHVDKCLSGEQESNQKAATNQKAVMSQKAVASQKVVTKPVKLEVKEEGKMGRGGEKKKGDRRKNVGGGLDNFVIKKGQ